jgi:hypothetical protein
MLRLYKPIPHDILKLHEMLEHLVCSVWCEASVDDCETKLNADFKNLYLTYSWLKEDVDEIYVLCQPLPDDERKAIRDAFETNNKIEELCNGSLTPIYLSSLPSVVENKMKPLLVDFYEKLLDKAKVPGTKQVYYKDLIEANDFQFCPCCGYMPIESKDSDYREAFDHYLPKSKYPFVSVNFKNLVPLCHKCNSDRKGIKDPIEDGKKAFFPFSDNLHSISIDLKIDRTKDLRALSRDDVEISLSGDADKIETWDRLFDIKERYNDRTRGFSKTFLSRIKRYHTDNIKNDSSITYIDSLNKIISDYTIDKYEDAKFLKIPFMEELKNCSGLIEVYG